MQRNKGVSLIVLVITIIVMVILAGAIILTLNNSGIIKKASNAVEATNLATVKEIAQVKWAEAYLSTDKTQEKLEEYVLAELAKEGITTEDYLIEVTTTGVEVKSLSGVWVQKGFTVVKGDKVLEIGDSIAYDETAGGSKTGLTSTDWKVLGADDDGNLLIMSTADVVSSHGFGSESTMTYEENLAESQKDWLNGAAELDGLCESYGYGKGVVGKARSITVEDVDKVTGYDKTTYGTGTLSQYGNEVTYSYNGTAFPAYTSATASGTLNFDHASFRYYNGTEFLVAHSAQNASGTITTIINNYYSYNAANLTTISKTDNVKAYSMIFGNDDISYWLSSSWSDATVDYAWYGMRYVNEGSVKCGFLWSSLGDPNRDADKGVRAVVTLSKDIELTGNSTNGWSY